MATLDHIDGLTDRPPSIRQDVRGYTISRSGIVKDLTNSTVALRTYDALQVSGVPEMFENYNKRIPPSRGQSDTLALYVIAREAEAIDQDKVKFTVTYGVPDGSAFFQAPSEDGPPIIEVGTTLISLESSYDSAGNRIYTGTYDPLLPADSTNPVVYQAASVTVQYPVTNLRMIRREPKSPALKSKAYAGKTNATNIWDGTPGTWLCSELGGESHDGGISYIVRYGFQYFGLLVKPEDGSADKFLGWDGIVQAIDPKTNQPYIPKSAPGGRAALYPPSTRISQLPTQIRGNSVTAVQIYQRAEFADLKLGII